MGALVITDLYEGGIFSAGVWGGLRNFLTLESTVVVGKEVPAEKDSAFFPSLEAGVHCLSVAPFFFMDVDVVVVSAMAREASNLRARSSVDGGTPSEPEVSFFSLSIMVVTAVALDEGLSGFSSARRAISLLGVVSFGLDFFGPSGTRTGAVDKDGAVSVFPRFPLTRVARRGGNSSLSARLTKASSWERVFIVGGLKSLRDRAE